jgi:hypothetical protein
MELQIRNQPPASFASYAILPGHYERSGTAGIAANQMWKLATPYATAANRYKVLSPDRLSVNINNSGYAITAQITIDLSVAANWDSVATDYTVAANRIGKDFYLYACQPVSGIAPVFILSANSTIPTGYDANTSRKIGGFHCLCADVGTIASHDLTGFVAGDVLPASIYDLKFKPREASPEGMVYSVAIGKWVDIYLTSGTGTSTASAYGATISDNRTWNDFVDDGAAVKKRLLKDAEFQMAAAGCNEQTNVYHSADPVKTGSVIINKQTTGSGLSDLTPARAATSLPKVYEILLFNAANPDQIKWRVRDWGGAFGGYSAAIDIVAGAMAIADGVTVTFAATTGHTLNNVWTFAVMNGLRDTAERRMISNIGLEGAAGVMYQWLDENSYQFGGPVAHTHQVTVSGDAQTVTSGAASADISPAFSWKTIGGNKGQLYSQGTYGDTKLLAGVFWYYGASCGSRARGANGSRWYTYTSIGGRFAAEPA